MKEYSLLLLLLLVGVVVGQFGNTTTQYQELLSEGTKELTAQIQSHPDVNLLFYPEREYINNNVYRYDYPDSSNYRLGVLIDPCRFNSYNCCMNVFGMAEYPALLNGGLDQERIYRYKVIGSDTDVSKNYFLVYEDGSAVDLTEQRSADDFAIYNESCIALNNPYSFCQGRNYAYQRSSLRPACMDNNSTLDLLNGCYAPNGTWMNNCVQVAYSSTTFIPQCDINEDDHCGTYLEVHMAHGSPYQNETEVISEVKLDQRNVSGYYSTVLPVTWMKNDSKILCSYSESVFREGSLVYIKPNAPLCCCPPSYDPLVRVGSFQCPIGSTGNGAYGARALSLSDTIIVDGLMQLYPYCHIDLSIGYDEVMCSVYDKDNLRAYTRNCTRVYQKVTTSRNSYTSADLQGHYEGVCPYYESCGLANSTICFGKDSKFQFVGQVGVVTKVDNEATIPQVWVTFNNGRTSYQFSQEHVQLQYYKSMYEIWWVVRSKSGFTVQKRKGFNVTSPACTFDATNNRYFPYAILQNGKPLDSSLYP